RFFMQMIKTRQMAVKQLQSFAVLEKGEMETGESTAVKIRQSYTKIKAAMTSDKAHTYVDQLEEVEDKTLISLDDAIKASEGYDCHNALLKVRLVIQTCHDDMKALQNATA
ncbi:MAG: PA2169 family four-helix-bundle protein, partial [Paraglaciecola sp.]